MKSFFSELSKRIYKVHKVDFERFNVTDDINKNNLQILKVGSLMMSMMFMIMFILSFFLKNYEGNRYFYFFEMLTTTIIYTCSKIFFKRKPVFILPSVYFFAAGLYYYGMHIGIVTSPDGAAVTLCLVLAVMPLLFIDGALRIILFSTVAEIVSILLICHIKTMTALIIDITNIFFSWIMGIALGIEVNRIRINNFIREREVAWERDTDGLTGLCNKNTIVKRVSSLIMRESETGAFFIMDLDKFKQINDRYGHSFGDEVLVKTAECIEKVFGSDDITGRFGGDEFIFYMHGADRERASEAAEKLLSFLYNDIKMPESEGLCGSIGIAIYTYTPDISYDSLMKMADKALYVTKKEGRFGYTVYSEDKMEKNSVKLV